MDFSLRTIHFGGPCVGRLFWGARTNSVAGAGHEPRRGGRRWFTKGHHLNSGWNMRKDRQNQTIFNMQINCYLLILPLQLFCMKSCFQQLKATTAYLMNWSCAVVFLQGTMPKTAFLPRPKYSIILITPAQSQNRLQRKFCLGRTRLTGSLFLWHNWFYNGSWNKELQ